METINITVKKWTIKDKYSYLKVQINGYTAPIVKIETAHGVLELLIAEYSLKVESLTKQIEAL